MNDALKNFEKDSFPEKFGGYPSFGSFGARTLRYHFSRCVPALILI